MVDGVEFVRYFFQLGNEEREAQRMVRETEIFKSVFSECVFVRRQVLLRSQERRRRQVQREQEEVLRRHDATSLSVSDLS